MKVKDFIAELQELPGDLTVVIINPDRPDDDNAVDAQAIVENGFVNDNDEPHPIVVISPSNRMTA